jgi:hypothetical protein
VNSLHRSTPTARRHLAIRVLAGLAVAAFVVGLIVGATTPSGAERATKSFASAWQRGDYARMYALLTPGARKRISAAAFRQAYLTAAATATAVSVDTGRVHGDSVGGRVDVAVRTRIFGVLRGSVKVPVVDDHVDWAPHLVFPGLVRGESLTRRTLAPKRAKILSRNGRTIVSGPATARVTDPSNPAASIVGTVAPPPSAAEQTALYARGFPLGTPVGMGGLERALEPELAGRPGGVLLAGRRRLAASAPQPARAVRSSIDLRVQAAAVQALAGRFGGIAALDPGTGRVRALAGIAFSAPQPPGSTFKIVTLAGVLQNKVAKRDATFPVQNAATIEGVDIQNANGESCGGSLRISFAHSCNSVFAPLGAKLGAERLVATAEKFGFNEQPTLTGAARSTIPAAAEIGDDLAVGSSAIGQGKVLATPLQMALIAATIGADGVRPHPTLLKGADAERVRATSVSIARTIKSYMRTVVTDGTGGAAALPGIKVSGKTGTAELRTTVREEPPPELADPNAPPPEEDLTDTDAWFTAFAPYSKPSVAVAVLLVGQGTGGDTAAPAAGLVLKAALAH